MNITEKHSFFKPEFQDDVEDSLSKYRDNFDKIDSLLPETVPSLELHLQVGKTYRRGEIILNEIPLVGGYLGWVNINEGVHALSWKKNYKYNINDVVTPVNKNGYYYRCVADGTSSPIEPTFPTTNGVQVDDAYGLLSWIPSKPYAVGDIVKKTSGGSEYYYRCTIAGTSDSFEPTWNNNAGTTIIDGSVSWVVCKKVIWEQIGSASNFRPFGKIE